MNEYTVKIIGWPSQLEGYEPGVIEVMRFHDGTDKSVRFMCPCGKVKVYIPLGEDNNEGGSGTRELHWLEKDKILSITPSIQIKGDCNEHFHITANKVVK